MCSTLLRFLSFFKYLFPLAVDGVLKSTSNHNICSRSWEGSPKQGHSRSNSAKGENISNARPERGHEYLQNFNKWKSKKNIKGGLWWFMGQFTEVRVLTSAVLTLGTPKIYVFFSGKKFKGVRRGGVISDPKYCNFFCIMKGHFFSHKFGFLWANVRHPKNLVANLCKTSPQAKCHKPSLLITSFTI